MKKKASWGLGKTVQTYLYFVELDKKIRFKEYSDLMNILSNNKQEKIQKMHFEEDKKLSLLTDLWVRYLTCVFFNIKNSNLQFKKNEYGKPYLVGVDNFYYNISHTRDAFIIGVSTDSIGVDIEKIREYEMGIATRFFTPPEVWYIKGENDETSKRFYEIWTKKEAYAKWEGKGLAIPLNSFSVFDSQIATMLKTKQFSEYLVSVCSNEFSSIKEFEFKENYLCNIVKKFQFT